LRLRHGPDISVLMVVNVQLRAGAWGMKKILAILAVFIGSATTGYAADLPAKAAPSGPTTFNWSGCFVGIEGGQSWGQSEQVAASGANIGSTITGKFTLTGGLAGATGGCNLEVSNFVFGMEDDFSWTNQHGSASDLPPFDTAATSTTRERWLNTLRGRVGYAFDRFMFYGTAGAAFAATEVSISGPVFGNFTDRQNRTGWVAGAGGEWAAWSLPWADVTVKVEYLHTDFGSALYFSTPVTVANITPATRATHLSDDLIRAGVNLKFNLGGSPAAATPAPAPAASTK
jgi:outer membrane immunogenic protein